MQPQNGCRKTARKLGGASHKTAAAACPQSHSKDPCAGVTAAVQAFPPWVPGKVAFGTKVPRGTTMETSGLNELNK